MYAYIIYTFIYTYIYIYISFFNIYIYIYILLLKYLFRSSPYIHLSVSVFIMHEFIVVFSYPHYLGICGFDILRRRRTRLSGFIDSKLIGHTLCFLPRLHFSLRSTCSFSGSTSDRSAAPLPLSSAPSAPVPSLTIRVAPRICSMVCRIFQHAPW